MPTAYAAEFRQDVIDVARKGAAPLTLITKDFGLSVATAKRWIAVAVRKESGPHSDSGRVVRDARTEGVLKFSSKATTGGGRAR